jgi:hypothetical protein
MEFDFLIGCRIDCRIARRYASRSLQGSLNTTQTRSVGFGRAVRPPTAARISLFAIRIAACAAAGMRRLLTRPAAFALCKTCNGGTPPGNLRDRNNATVDSFYRFLNISRLRIDRAPNCIA